VCVCVCASERVRACKCPGARACACERVLLALFIQHATHMNHTVTSFVASVSPANVSTLPHKRHNFRGKVLEHKSVF
jgi:hypothetical protein